MQTNHPCRCRNTAYFKLLLDAGEKQGNTVDTIENGGWTAAMRACEYANDDALQLIISRGANLEAKLDATGMTALLMCVLHEHYACTRLLLEGGANVNATDMYGNTPLMLAAEYCDECWGHAFLNITPNTSNRDGTAILSLLIANKVDVNATNRRQGTALILASYHGLFDCVQMLLRVQGIDVEAMDDDGDTALSCATARGHAHIVTLLIEHGANVNVIARLWPTAKQGKASILNTICCAFCVRAGCRHNATHASGAIWTH
jgi:ankyrin repeat protein